MEKNNKNIWRTGKMLMVILMALPFMLALTMPTASAVVGEEWAVQSSNGQGVFIIGLVGLILLMVIQYGAGYELTGSLFGMLLIAVVAMMMVIPMTLGAIVWLEGEDEQTFCEQYPDDPSCKVTEPVLWRIDLDPDGDVDGSAYPAGAFTAVDTAIGGTTGEWVTATDHPLVNDVTHEITSGVMVNTSMNWDNALWMEPNAIFIEAAEVKLMSGPKSVTGAIETQVYYGRIDSIQWIVPSGKDNESGDPVDPIYVDGTWVHHIGWQDENNIWRQACEEYQGMPLPQGASCDPVPLGDDNMAGDAIKAIASGGIRLFWIWEDRGPFNWNAQDGATWSLTFSIGSNDDWHTWTYTAHYLEDAAADNA